MLNYVLRSGAEIEDALFWGRTLDMDNSRHAGAITALYWLTGRTDRAPISGEVGDPRSMILAETSDAIGVMLGTDEPQSGKGIDFARGVEGVLMWAMGKRGLPAWLRHAGSPVPYQSGSSDRSRIAS